MHELPASHADLLINASFVSFLLSSVSIPHTLCWNHFLNTLLVLTSLSQEEPCWGGQWKRATGDTQGSRDDELTWKELGLV